jgi:hypothetical protein
MLSTAGLDINQGTEANGRGALSDWLCALKNSFHIFLLSFLYFWFNLVKILNLKQTNYLFLLD